MIVTMAMPSGAAEILEVVAKARRSSGRTILALVVVTAIFLVWMAGSSLRRSWNGASSKDLTVEQAWIVAADDSMQREARRAAIVRLRYLGRLSAYALWQAEAAHDPKIAEEARAYRKDVRAALER